jgi:antiviral helicase SKI2
LILTELILENTLGSYDPEEVVALLSCFVFQEKTDVEPIIPQRLEEGRDAILAIGERVGRVQDSKKVVAEEFRTTSLKFGLVEVVYEWAKGMVSSIESLSIESFLLFYSYVLIIFRVCETNILRLYSLSNR